MQVKAEKQNKAERVWNRHRLFADIEQTMEQNNGDIMLKVPDDTIEGVEVAEAGKGDSSPVGAVVD